MNKVLQCCYIRVTKSRRTAEATHGTRLAGNTVPYTRFGIPANSTTPETARHAGSRYLPAVRKELTVEV